MQMRLFWLNREEDKSGVSGLGIVAEGVEFTTGRCALTWIKSEDAATNSSYAIYDSIEDIEKIHGHNGTTQIVFDR